MHMDQTRTTGTGQHVAEHCDVCKQERISVREGDTYVCEVCLDQESSRMLHPLP